jgi:hypothetical protein
LKVGVLDGPSAESWASQAKDVDIGVRLKTGELEPSKEGGPLCTHICEALGQRLAPALLDTLQCRRARTREWGAENGWRYQDWSNLPPGARAGWAEVFPATEDICAQDLGAGYVLDDQYCCTQGCPCTDVILAILRVSAPSMVVMGYLTYDYVTGKQGPVDHQGGGDNELRRLLQLFFLQNPTMGAELRRRGSFMSGPFATLLREQRDAAGPEQPVRNTKVGRNDPCPCGSGKKYKKCCLA